MVKPEQVIGGIAAFAEAEILPTLDGWQLWAGSAALVLAVQRADAFITAVLNHKALSALGVVDKNGMIDIDAAIDALKEVARKRGKLTVDLWEFGKFSFNEGNVDDLKEYILNAEK